MTLTVTLLKSVNKYDENIYSGVDVLIVAADLNQTSKNMVNIKALNKLSNSNIIINPARGGIIVEEDLVQYLQKTPTLNVTSMSFKKNLTALDI